MGSRDVTHVWLGETPVGSSHHHEINLPGYVMHTRILDSRDGVRYVIELQSDVYQKQKAEQDEDRVWAGYEPDRNPLTVREQDYMQKNWWKRAIREEVRLAFELGLRKMRFRTAETTAKLEGWNQYNFHEKLKGMRVLDENGSITNDKFTGEAVFDSYSKSRTPPIDALILNKDGEIVFRTFYAGEPQYNVLEEQLQEAPDKKTYGPNQGIFNR